MLLMGLLNVMLLCLGFYFHFYVSFLFCGNIKESKHHKKLTVSDPLLIFEARGTMMKAGDKCV